MQLEEVGGARCTAALVALLSCSTAAERWDFKGWDFDLKGYWYTQEQIARLVFALEQAPAEVLRELKKVLLSDAGLPRTAYGDLLSAIAARFALPDARSEELFLVDLPPFVDTSVDAPLEALQGVSASRNFLRVTQTTAECQKAAYWSARGDKCGSESRWWARRRVRKVCGALRLLDHHMAPPYTTHR